MSSAKAESVAETTTKTQVARSFDLTDALIAAALHSKADNQDANIKPINTKELYNTSDEITAYEIILSDYSYIVVNADLSNPIVIEFGQRDELYCKYSTEKEYYIGPTYRFERATNKQSELFVSESSKSTEIEATVAELQLAEEKLKTALQSVDTTQKSIHSEARSLFDASSNGISKNKDKNPYDFIIDFSSLPSASTLSSSKTITSATSTSITPYGTTNDFDGVNDADNHCAATSAYNMVIYYMYRNGDTIPTSETAREALFTAIHKRIKNGPVTPSGYRTRIKKYVNNDMSGYSITVDNIRDNWDNYKAECDSNRMSLMCLWPALFNAHMVNGIGYRTYSNGSKYCQIINNWYSDLTQYCIFGQALYDLSKIYITK
jgi:hypothetical protein